MKIRRLLNEAIPTLPEVRYGRREWDPGTLANINILATPKAT